MLYSNVVEELKNNKQRRLSGDVIAIPWSLPRLAAVLPGIERSRYNLISASPKGGKTQLTDFLFVYQPIEWYIKHRNETDVTLKIFYFSLEVNKMAKIKAAASYKLLSDYGILISPQKLSSVFGDYILDDKIEEIINSSKFRNWFDVFESIVTVYDTVKSPDQIFHFVKTYAEHPDNGSYTYKDVPWKNDNGTYTQKRIIDKYVPKRPNEYVIIITDHIGLLQPKPTESLHQAISRFSSDYSLYMRDRWGYIPCAVQQQTADSSRAQFTNRGDTVVDKVKPDIEGLADMKYTARDVDLMISLFYPRRYNIENYQGIDLTRIGDNHRELMINLNRNGISNASIQLMFLGSSSFFSELPRQLTEFDYMRYEQLIKSQI
jgi:hypothetical protein